MLGHVNYVTIVADYIIKEIYMQAVAHFIETFVPEHYDIFLDLNRGKKHSQVRSALAEKQKVKNFSSSEGFDNPVR